MQGPHHGMGRPIQAPVMTNTNQCLIAGSLHLYAKTKKLYNPKEGESRTQGTQRKCRTAFESDPTSFEGVHVERSG